MDLRGTVLCVCGVELARHSTSIGGNGVFINKSCPSCGFKALFFSVPDNMAFSYSVSPVNSRELAGETKEKLLKVFRSANVGIKASWNIENEYYGKDCDWLLVKTDRGLVKIGWRKRVIAIDWGDTGIEHLVSGDVTKDKYSCHAWSYDNASKYLMEVWAS